MTTSHEGSAHVAPTVLQRTVVEARRRANKMYKANLNKYSYGGSCITPEKKFFSSPTAATPEVAAQLGRELARELTAEEGGYATWKLTSLTDPDGQDLDASPGSKLSPWAN